MKKLLSLPVLVLISSIAAAQEPAPQPSRSIFKISPQHFTQKQLKVGFERFNQSYSRSFSFYVNGLWDLYDGNSYDEGYSGLGAEFQYRKYIVPLGSRTTKKGNNY